MSDPKNPTEDALDALEKGLKLSERLKKLTATVSELKAETNPKLNWPTAQSAKKVQPRPTLNLPL